MYRLKKKYLLLKNAHEMFDALVSIQAAAYNEQVPVSKIPRIAFATQDVDAVLKKMR